MPECVASKLKWRSLAVTVLSANLSQEGNWDGEIVLLFRDLFPKIAKLAGIFGGFEQRSKSGRKKIDRTNFSRKVHPSPARRLEVAVAGL